MLLPIAGVSKVLGSGSFKISTSGRELHGGLLEPLVERQCDALPNGPAQPEAREHPLRGPSGVHCDALPEGHAQLEARERPLRSLAGRHCDALPEGPAQLEAREHSLRGPSGVHCDALPEGPAQREARERPLRGLSGCHCDKGLGYPERWRWRHWSVRELPSPKSCHTSAAELFYLRHVRSCAASSLGCRCSGSSQVSRSLEPEGQTPWFIALSVRVAERLSAGLAVLLTRMRSRLGGGASFIFGQLLTPRGPMPLVALAAATASTPGASDKALQAALHVLLATLGDMHFGQPLCSILSAAAAWDLMDGHTWLARSGMAVYMYMISPAFPLLGTPLGGERINDTAQEDEQMGDSNTTARNLLSELTADSVQSNSQDAALSSEQDARQQSGLTQQMRDLSVDDGCPVCLMPLQDGTSFAWPSCGSIQHHLHLACAAALVPMQQALAHLRNCGDSSRFGPVPCVTCRTPWGESDSSNEAIQRFCGALEAEGIPLPSRGCRCTTCTTATVGQDQEFERRYGDSKAAELQRLFSAVVSQARSAPDTRRFVESRTWSDFVVPMLWMAAAADGSTGAWPSSLGQLCCHVPTLHESGLQLGAQGMTDAWQQLRASFRASGIECMEDLRSAVRDARAEITAWAAQDSRFAGASVADDHFNAGRGAHLENYIQEWLFHRVEQSSASNVGTILSANLQAAVLQAAPTRASSSSLSETTSTHAGPPLTQTGARRDAPPAAQMPAAPGPTSTVRSTFVHGGNLVTGAGWQSTQNGVDGSDATRRQTRRRTSNRVFCPCNGCPHSDQARSAGWGSIQNMRPHLQEHAWGRAGSAIPAEFLHEQRWDQCSVCNALISTRFGGTCPRHRPQARAAGDTGASVSGRNLNGLPALDTIFSMQAPTVRHVPAAARHWWARCLVQALANIVFYNDERAWRELAMMPKSVLRPAARGGKKNSVAAANHTISLCRRWLDGERAPLWGEVRERKSKKRRRGNDENTPVQDALYEYCASMAGEKLYAKACSALISDGPVQASAEVMRTLREKHPDRPAPDLSTAQVVSAAAWQDIGQRELQKILKSFPRGSASGPSGLRPQHLLDAERCRAHSDEVLTQLAAVVNLMAKGLAPAAVAPFFAGASLTALAKENGGIRPVAVGETLRRLTGKAVCNAATPRVTEALAPLQIGVGLPMATEAAVHAVRGWLDRQTDNSTVLLKLDLANAFNSIDRQCMLLAAREFPELVPFADWCYREASQLQIQGRQIKSATGVQQGDPLGPVLFCLGVHQAIRTALDLARREGVPDVDMCFFYLDDGLLAGRAESVEAVFRHLRAELARI